MRNRGFTLIELLVVISIISLLSSVVMTNINQSRIKARNLQRIANADAIAKGFQVAITGTTSAFPNTVSVACLGVPVCWEDSLYEYEEPGVNPLLRTGMASGVIPLDPFWKAPDSGDAFLYFKSYAYATAGIIWVMEYDPSNTSHYCGRGVSLGEWNTTVAGTWACVLTFDGERGLQY